MPQAIEVFLTSGNYEKVNKIKSNILNTYIDDFNKYHEKVNYVKMLDIFRVLPHVLGQKIKYVNLSKNYNSAEISKAISLFECARICSFIFHSSSQGLPLSAGINKKHFKLLFLDVGLMLSSLGLNITDIKTAQNLILINSGALCEQFIGQHLLYQNESYHSQELHCWMREKPSSNAGIDFLFSKGSNIIPIEIKAGKTGSLRSLHQFVVEHKTKQAVRFNTDKPSIVESRGFLANKEKYSYNLLSLPVYMVEHIQKFI